MELGKWKICWKSAAESAPSSTFAEFSKETVQCNTKKLVSLLKQIKKQQANFIFRKF